jgi:hypothetical protein
MGKKKRRRTDEGGPSQIATGGGVGPGIAGTQTCRWPGSFFPFCCCCCNIPSSFLVRIV